jgi:hypothetical protein
MPLNIKYVEDGGIIVKGEGVLTGSEIKEINDIIYESPEKIEKILYQLGDFTDVSDVSISNAEIEELAIQDMRAFKVNPNMFIALVAKEGLIFGLARMWEAFAYKPPFETMVFKKMDDAQQWIREKLHKKPKQTVPPDRQ